jgi:hypothetical protein
LKKWSELGAKVFLRLGSWDDQNQMTPQKFSQFLGAKDSMATFTKYLVDYIFKNRLISGLLISWYYPVCHQVSFFVFLAQILRQN